MASTPTATKIGHGLAKALGIKLQYRDPTGQSNITRGESVYSVSSADTFVEEEPSTLEWFQSIAPNRQTFIHWASNLFPFIHWIDRYNVQWLTGDLIAGGSPLYAPLSFRVNIEAQVSPWVVSLSLSPWLMPNWPGSM